MSLTVLKFKNMWWSCRKRFKDASDYFEAQKMCKKAVKKLLFTIKNVPDQHKTKQICETVTSKNPGKLKFISNC